MCCYGGVTCAGCPIETLNVVGVGVRVSVESSGGGHALPIPCVGMLVGVVHSCFLISFRDCRSG